MMMNNTTKALLAFIRCSGMTDAREISAHTEIPLATVYRCLKIIRLNALMGENIPTHGNENIPTSEKKIPTSENPPRARVSYPEENIKPPIIPQTLDLVPPADKPKAARKLAGFDDWYALYPKKVGKAAAERAWPGAVKRAGSPEAIIEALKQQLPALEAKDRQYVKNPATWLNQGCWDDEIEKPDPKRIKWTKQQIAERCQGMSHTEIRRFMMGAV